MRRMLAFCGYDFRNVGDDAFLVALSGAARRGGAQAQVTSSYVPEGAIPEAIEPLYRDLGRYRGAHVARLLSAGPRLDQVVFFGGSVFHDLVRYPTERLKLAALRALHPGLRVAAVGVSVGPLTRPRAARDLAALLSSFDHVSVRDRTSLDLLRRLRVRVPVEHHFDLAALLLDAPFAATAPRRDPTLLGIAPCAVQRYLGGDATRMDAVTDAVVDACRRLRGDGLARVRLFEFNGSSDHGDGRLVARMAERLRPELAVETVPYAPRPLAAMHAVGECGAMIAMRLHSAVFAYLHGTPLVLLSYHPKCLGFADEIALPAACRHDFRAIDGAALARAVTVAWRDAHAAAPPVPAAVASARRHLTGLSAA